jgi:hypothetical protein
MGSLTLESTLLDSERGAISLITASLNLEDVAIIVSTYSLLAASKSSDGLAT